MDAPEIRVGQKVRVDRRALPRFVVAIDGDMAWVREEGDKRGTVYPLAWLSPWQGSGGVMDAPDEMVDKPSHEHALPEGYFLAASGDTLPFFDQEGRAIVLRFWPDGTVTWQLRGRGGEVLEPAGRELAAMLKEEAADA